jgi:hypothetical protein
VNASWLYSFVERGSAVLIAHLDGTLVVAVVVAEFVRNQRPSRLRLL